MNYKIVASDLDGTLLDDKAQISRENLDAIKELLNKGVYFVPSTGRTFSEIPAELKDNQDIRYVIHSNGAVVLDKKTGHRILNCISNDTGRKILDVVNKYECHITYRQNGECFVDAAYQTDEAFELYNVCPGHQVVVREFSIYLENFEKMSYSADDVEVFSVFFRNYEDKMTCKKILEEMGNLRVVEVSEYNIEVVNINAGKGNALRSLADMLGVAYSDTISIGDSDNDCSITKAAGLGLAVSNACDSLKAIADEIICSNEEHAVRFVLSHYFGRNKMDYNYHTHTYRCHHASGTPEEYIKRAIEGGIKYMGFSDHLPYICSNGEESSYRVSMTEAKDYISEIATLREKYKNKIDIKIGFEMEYFPEFFEKMLKSAISFGAEYLILGEHFITEENPGAREKHLFNKCEDVSKLRRYAEIVVLAIESGVFTYVAHPDMFCFVGDDEVYKEQMRKICVASREHNVPLEINFLGIRDNRHYPNEMFWEIAGEEKAPVTFGFDAHDAENACDEKSLERAEMLVKKFNLNYIGKPDIIDIGKPEV